MLARQTYLELNEIESTAKINFGYERRLSLVYISVTEGNNHSLHVPVHSSFMMSPWWMHNVGDLSKGCRPLVSIILIIRDEDSTVVRYRFTNGLVLLSSNPYDKKEKKKTED